MGTAFWGRGILGLIGSALLALAMSGPALAEEAPTVPAVGVTERLATLQTSVADHKRAKDTDALKGDIKLIVVLHGDAAQVEKVRKECIRLLGGLAKGGRLCVTVQVAAIAGLGQTRDPGGARYLTTHLKRSARVSKESALLRAAVSASAQLCSDKLIEPLLKIVTRSKNYTLAAQAIQALGHFRQCKRKRVKILKTLIETIAKDCPGAKGRNKDPIPNDQYRHTGELARNRWLALSRVLPGALVQLTGREELKGATTDDWIEHVRSSKRNLAGLFVDEEE